VGVDRVHVLSARMPHERFADFLHNSRFHESCVKGVPEIMEPVVADARSADGGFPRGLHRADRALVEREDDSCVLPEGEKFGVRSFSERHFPALASGGFRTADKEQVPAEIDVLPALCK
jgi:hypothetical protein